MIYKRHLLISSIVAITACNTNITNKAGKISYSVAYGMCQGYCVTMVEVTPIAITTNKSSDREPEKFPLQSDTKNITKEEWKQILNSYNWDDFQKMDSAYGCPGCADGGIATIAITNKNDSKSIRFEEENVPPAIKPLVDLLKTKTATMALSSINNVNQQPAMTAYDFHNLPATVKNYVCSRGCYQYVMEATLNGKKVRLYDDSLAETYKNDGQQIFISGNFTGGKTEIKKPAPNDVPVRDFDATNVVIKEIKAKN